MPQHLLQKQVVASRLVVVSVRLDELHHLLVIEVLTFHQLLDYVDIYGNDVASDYDPL